MLRRGKKWGRAEAIQPSSPACVCWEVKCSNARRDTAEIVIRAINEALAAPGAGLCQGRGMAEGQNCAQPRSAEQPGQLRCGEGMLSTPSSCQISSQLLGHGGVSVPQGRARARSVAFRPPLPPCRSVVRRVAVLLLRLYLVSVSINSFPQSRGCGVALWGWGQGLLPPAAARWGGRQLRVRPGSPSSRSLHTAGSPK